MKKQSALILLIISIVYNTFGQSFVEHHIITSGSLPSTTSSIEVADINNDGDPDILACSSLGRYIYLLENKGNQEFEVLQELEFDLYELSEVKSGDINNDGLMDIVYSRYDYSNQLGWLRNIGGNKFEKAGYIFSMWGAGWRTVSFSIHDLNGDNYDDLVIGCIQMDCELEVKINKGDGTFHPNSSLIDEGDLKSYQCIDFDNDDDIDIVYSKKYPYSLIASINNGNGEFSEEVIIDTNDQNPVYYFHSFDSDGDNDIDILGLAENDSIALFINNGENVFTQVIVPNDSLFVPSHAISLDFDNDGDLDLINRLFEVFENIGNNNFQYKKDDDFSFYTCDYEVTDLNNNGDEDIVYAYRSGSIGYIEDASFENLKNWRILTSQVLRPKYPAYEKINDDEFPDICVLDDHYKYVFYLNNGFGEFTDTITMDKLHVYSNESAFYDINKDGYCDIVSYSDQESMSFNDSSNFKLAINNGDNTFTTYYVNDFNYLQDRYSNFTDYNNDNVLNAVLPVRRYNDGTDSILIFNINPDYTVSNYDTIVLSPPIEIINLKFYDVDNNGQNDIIINDEHSLYIVYSINGHFNNHLDTIAYSAERIYDFVPAKINKDTICDILFATTYDIIVLENFDGISFEQSYILEINEFPRKLYARDINNDSIDEVFYVSEDKIGLLNNIENNSYSIEEYYYKNKPWYIGKETPFIFTDIDMDGDDDLFCTYHMESDISWFENYYMNNSTEEVPTNNFFTIFPNPAKTNFYISNSDGKIINEISLFNQLGQKVLHKKGIISKVDISTLGKGLYIVEMITNEMLIRRKLIIN